MSLFSNEQFADGVFANANDVSRDDVGKVVKRRTNAANDIIGRVPVELTGTTDNADDIYGVIIDSVEGNLARIQVGGYAVARAAGTPANSHVGTYATASGTAGLAGQHTAGTVPIVGHGTRQLAGASRNVYIIDLG